VAFDERTNSAWIIEHLLNADWFHISRAARLSFVKAAYGHPDAGRANSLLPVAAAKVFGTPLIFPGDSPEMPCCPTPRRRHGEGFDLRIRTLFDRH
jgi:hypothetical protein